MKVYLVIALSPWEGKQILGIYKDKNHAILCLSKNTYNYDSLGKPYSQYDGELIIEEDEVK